jgi:hypothetical protein
VSADPDMPDPLRPNVRSPTSSVPGWRRPDRAV